MGGIRVQCPPLGTALVLVGWWRTARLARKPRLAHVPVVPSEAVGGPRRSRADRTRGRGWRGDQSLRRCLSPVLFCPLLASCQHSAAALGQGLRASPVWGSRRSASRLPAAPQGVSTSRLWRHWHPGPVTPAASGSQSAKWACDREAGPSHLSHFLRSPGARGWRPQSRPPPSAHPQPRPAFPLLAWRVGVWGA